MTKKNVIGLAKKTNNKLVDVESKDELIEITDDRDAKVKKKVAELLEGIELTPKQKEEIIELDTEHKQGVEWLEEQVALLSESNEKLRQELADSKEDYKKIFEENQDLKKGVVISDDIVKNNVIKLFNEIQENYFKMGKNAQGQPNLVLPPVAFMNRMIMFFSFLNKHKKY